MLKEHKTILNETHTELTAKKSRFLASAFPVAGEDDITLRLGEIRKEYYDAGHHCYAYRLARDVPAERFSDDGEPSQTAGLPILGVISGLNLLNVLVVVTRYFGGTLLGTGGLVRAYSGAAKECLAEAELIDKKIYAPARVITDYGGHKKLAFELVKRGFYIGETIFQSNVEVIVFVPPERLPGLEACVNNATNGKAAIIKEAEVLGYFLNEKLYTG